MTKEEIEAMYNRLMDRATENYDADVANARAKYADAVVMAGAEYDRAMAVAGYTIDEVEDAL